MKKLILCLPILSILVCHCSGVIIRNIEMTTGSIDPSFIRLGSTTKEDVVLRCGYPSTAVSGDEKVFTYSWRTTTTRKVTPIIFDISSDMPPTLHTYITDLQIHFDENDIVKNYTLDEKKKE